MARQFFKRLNWKSFIVMVICGVGFYVFFNNLIEKSKSHGTAFIIEIKEDNLSGDALKQALEKTVAVYESRMTEINLPDADLHREDDRHIVFYIPRLISDAEAKRIKQILVKQDGIFYRLAVYGPLKR